MDIPSLHFHRLHKSRMDYVHRAKVLLRHFKLALQKYLIASDAATLKESSSYRNESKPCSLTMLVIVMLFCITWIAKV
jgi:hypothetical protein